MATILIYAGVKGYKKYQLKRANSSAELPPKTKKNRKSISSLVIPSVTSANIIPIHEFTDDPSLPEYDEKGQGEPPKYTAPYSPDSIGPPTRLPPPPPVMLGLTLCTSPTATASELDGNSSVDCLSSVPSELQGDSPIACPGEVFELAGDELSEPLSPAPLHVVKRGLAPPLPELTFSSDESEEEHEAAHQAPPKSSLLLEVPESVEDLEPPPIPPKSPRRKLRVVSS
jgi:hypothetical protein